MSAAARPPQTKRYIPGFVPELVPEFVPEFNLNSELYFGANSGMNSGTYLSSSLVCSDRSENLRCYVVSWSFLENFWSYDNNIVGKTEP